MFTQVLYVWTFCNLKITIAAPRNLGQNFKRLYDFLWRYERDNIIYAQIYDNTESPKKFWATFVANLLFNKRICKIWHHFFLLKSYSMSKWQFFLDNMAAVALYFISEEFNIICIHKKIIDDVRTKGTHKNPPKKILAQNFS